MWLIIARNPISNGAQVIHHVRWRKARADANGKPVWDGDEEIVPVGTVVHALRNGEEVGSLFSVPGGGTVSGPRVVIGKDYLGHERIDTVSDPQSVYRSLLDLPEFDV
ncbi:hypothetical protein [Paraburkholderia kururiensis]|uniref:Uncharacterized protein n=1 Tax=Paraburkholderia kururiensis TaxID=984307 RepID=A0ABZ0WRY0_9BURK|nr:hypothetical protein [Paraburkholderia kururiensis]WQD80160.1 hypothetical protein U0042_11000 [Paraburkholderia kururiensis]